MPSARHWCCGPFRLDPVITCLWQESQLVPLPPRPFAVLAYLVGRAGKGVPKDKLRKAVWPVVYSTAADNSVAYPRPADN